MIFNWIGMWCMVYRRWYCIVYCIIVQLFNHVMMMNSKWMWIVSSSSYSTKYNNKRENTIKKRKLRKDENDFRLYLVLCVLKFTHMYVYLDNYIHRLCILSYKMNNNWCFQKSIVRLLYSYQYKMNEKIWYVFKAGT